MGRRKTDATTVSFRLNNSTIRQLKIEAKAAGRVPLGTYLRRLIQAYAPGEGAAEAPANVSKLRQAAAQTGMEL